VTIESIIKDLMEYWGSKMGDSRVKHYHEKIRPYTPELLKRAAEQSKNKGRGFPTVNELMAFVREQQNRDWQQQKEAEPKELPEPADAQCSQDAWRMVHQALDRSVSRSQLLAEMRIMEVAYPGNGWMGRANELDTFYRKRALPVNDKPRQKFLTLEGKNEQVD